MNLNLLYRLLYRHWPLRKARTRVNNAAWHGIHGYELARDDFGNRLLLDLEQFIDSHIYLDGSFEKESVALLRDVAEREKYTHFVDIGANLGQFTVAMAGLAAIERVHAFEPDPRNYAQLEANLFLNGLFQKVDALRTALSDTTGEADFYLTQSAKSFDHGKMNAGTSSLHFHEGRHGQPIRVPVARLDDLLALEGKSVIVKIDVEGHETAVLRGMCGLLEKNRCLLHMESFPASQDEAVRLLGGLGYKARTEYRLAGDNFIFSRAD